MPHDNYEAKKCTKLTANTATPCDIDGDIMLVFVRPSALDDPHFDPDSRSDDELAIDEFQNFI